MVQLPAVRANNASLARLGPGQVAVFVGGTSGIGEATAREFVQKTDRPRVYLIGRNEAQASRILKALRELNPEGHTTFIKQDIALLRGADEACAKIMAKEHKVNLLFMTAGMITWQEELVKTSEGLDQKFSLHYYSRMRFAMQLLPLLKAAAEETPGALSRVVNVFSAGHEGPLDLDDLSLEKRYGLQACATHASTMTTLAMEHLARQHPETAFIHTFPGIVKTGLVSGFGPLVKPFVLALMALYSPWMVPLAESGERHLYAATSPRFPPRNAGLEVAVGVDGVEGSGSYSLHWDGEPYTKNTALLDRYRSEGVTKLVWEHTLDVFKNLRRQD
ncbi:NAD(P)-binding protein [Aspergillus homomorphus CBS 101889]|uniref:NAD(P)-binding protein n=1 Tax=Aspergillus homomorphus (strain CBS 101889) TaxID=1450537 RepID=A0A395I2Z0_ASPHC|nr:NAD(P)-binding protein [Aspergillus homomorphus CBS 101889]RAL14076.1 NAD(P)-binding protein [Aspergillus homomorphus CBS 101889]